MSQTLYRKYRPKAFAEMVGQEHILLTLQNQIKGGTIAQAYLFTGPRGTGKTTTARIFAALCNAGGKEELAQEILEGRDLDVIEIDAASHSGVDNVRENIIENARVTPNLRPFKIFIIDEVHMLSTSAFNALLKLIEEPPKHIMFILATTELHKVPATIISRCQRYDFRRFAPEQMFVRLQGLCKKEGVQVDDAVIHAVVRHADGSLRDGESLLGQILSSGSKNISLEQAGLLLSVSQFQAANELMGYLAERDSAKALTLVNTLAEKGADLNQFCHDFLNVARLVMLSQQGIENKVSADGEISALAKRFQPAEILSLIQLFSENRQLIKSSILPQLPLELAIIKFANQSISAPAPSASAPASPRLQPAKTTEQLLVTPVMTEAVKAEPAPVEPEPIKPAAPQVSASSVTIEQVRDAWNRWLSALQAENPSLVLILKTAEPQVIEGDTLTIGCTYPFHKDRMNSIDSKKIMEEHLLGIFNAPLKVTTTVLPAGHKSTFIEKQREADEVELVADASTADNASLFVEQAEETNQPISQDALIQNLVQAFGGKIID